MYTKISIYYMEYNGVKIDKLDTLMSDKCVLTWSLRGNRICIGGMGI